MTAVPGTFAGLRLFIPRPARTASAANFLGRLPDGGEVVGLCRWEPRPVQPEVRTAEEFVAEILASPNRGLATCSFQSRRGPGDMWLEISFGADVLGDWHAIHERFQSAIERYLRTDRPL